MDLTARSQRTSRAAPAGAKRPVGRPKKAMDMEARVRREIANHRERQRVKSINDGIQALREVLQSDDSQAISKSAVLFRCADYILSLERHLSLHIEENILLKFLTAKKSVPNI